MKIIFFGTGAFGLPSLDALKSSGHPILSIVSSADKPQGRKLVLKASPVKEWALAHGAPFFESIQELKHPAADAFVVIDYGVILPQALLDVPRVAPLNVHASLLPRHRGASPIHTALLNGDAETGVTVIRMTARLDAGDILVQKKTPILPADDIFSLEKKLGLLGAGALLETLDQLEKGAVRPKAQNELEGKKILPAEEFLRGFPLAPGAVFE
ncbi:MAG: methionyl-tRNA formyltransferase [Candidatus Omnitrophica bacterium]|nr:methionyl-tRNA formyltransferase [Candidatus Omnitrophota bacterium]